MISVINNVRPAIENVVEPITRAGSVLLSIFSVKRYLYSQLPYDDPLPYYSE
jgi:hypothetical protein